MLKSEIKYGKNVIPIIENESKSKNLLLFFHGLDGSAAFAKPLFKYFGEDIKIVIPEQRGHHHSKMKPSRYIHKHIRDYKYIISHFKQQGYKIWALGESMGGGYLSYLSFTESDTQLEKIFATSIPNKIKNIQEKNFWFEQKVSLMTFISYVTNISFYHKQRISYEKLSNNRALQRLASMADKDKRTSTLERLSTWALMKRIWRIFKSDKIPSTPIHYFSPDDDILCDYETTKQKFNERENLKLTFLKDTKHIVMYEKENYVVFDAIKAAIKNTK